MNRILSKISGPLLVGSILALGALAWPGAVSAQEARFFFRHSPGLLPLQVASAPEDGTPESPPPGGADAIIPYVTIIFSDGSIYECRSSDGFEATYGVSLEEITSALAGQFVFVDGSGRATVTLQDYSAPSRPWGSTDWTFTAGRLHAPRVGCAYDAAHPASVEVSGNEHPIPADLTLIINSAFVERK